MSGGPRVEAAAGWTVAELAELLGGRAHGQLDRRITGVAAAEAAGPAELTFAIEERTLARTGAAGCVLASAGSVCDQRTWIELEDPKLAFVKAVELFHPAEVLEPGIDPRAQVDPSAALGRDVRIEAFAVVARGAVLGDRAVVGHGSVVGPGARVGAASRLFPRVVLYAGVRIGERCWLHAGCVIGSDGFGYVRDGPAARKFPQLGTVVIEDDVEIGANSTVDRGALGETRIGRGTKIDNLVQVGHNVRIGEHCLIAAQTGIGGSSVIGDHCVLAGQVGIADHVVVEARATVAAKAGVPPGKILRGGEVYWGIPARPLAVVKRQIAALALLAKARDE
jgi:UDP-3-O-[3-hydroxymyristoyl] glucosamine N-acyltransferase